MGKQMAEFPLQTLFPALFAILVYWMVGLPSEWYIFGTFLSLTMLITCFACSLGLLFSAALNYPTAVEILPALTNTGLLFAGFYINIHNIPGWIKWLRFASPFYYTYQAAVLNQFGDLPIYCKNDQFLFLFALGKCSSGELLLRFTIACPVTNGNTIVKLIGADVLEIWQYQLILMSSIIFVRILLYLALKFSHPVENW